LGKKIFTAVLALVLAAMTAFGGAGKYAPYFGASSAEAAAKKIFSPEYAIPVASPGSDAIVAKIADMRSFVKIMPYVSSFLQAASGDVLPMAGLRLNRGDIADWFSFFRRTDAFWDAADSAAVRVTPGGGFYASFSVDGKKFDKFAASGPMKLEKWDGAKVSSGADAWILKSSQPEIAEERFYMTRWSAGERDAVYVASGAEEIGEMTEAANDSEKRLSVTRLTEGENFVAMNLVKPMEMNGLLLNKAETSWSVKGNELAIRSYSDMYEPIASRLAGRAFSPGAAPMLGDGEAVFFASVDPAFCFSVMFPTEPDPIKKVVELSGIGPNYRALFEGILRNCRISAVAVDKGQTLDAAYLLVESEARGELEILPEILYTLAKVMFAGLEEVSIQLEDWNVAIGLKLDPQFNVIMAWREGMLLLGIGETASFGKKAVVSVAVPPPDASRVLALTSSPRILEVKPPGLEETLRDLIEKYLAKQNMPEAFRDTAWLDKIGRLDFAHYLGGNSEINITFKE
jgi:hypothetical protein